MAFVNQGAEFNRGPSARIEIDEATRQPTIQAMAGHALGEASGWRNKIPRERHDLMHEAQYLMSTHPADMAAIRTIPISEASIRELRNLGIDV